MKRLLIQLWCETNRKSRSYASTKISMKHCCDSIRRRQWRKPNREVLEQREGQRKREGGKHKFIQEDLSVVLQCLSSEMKLIQICIDKWLFFSQDELLVCWNYKTHKKSCIHLSCNISTTSHSQQETHPVSSSDLHKQTHTLDAILQASAKLSIENCLQNTSVCL